MSLETRIAQARGEVPADMVLRGAEVLCTVTGALLKGDVAISEGIIIGVGDSYDGREVIDLSGQVLVPGFIDTHLHIESSLVTPFEFDRCVAPRGVTTAICDPHEIANVAGSAGIRYFLDAALRTVMDIRVNLSSCVPSTHMETAGADLDAQALIALSDHPKVIGLAEFMNFPGVIHRDPGCMEKLHAFAGRHIDGHAPLLSGRDLNAYVTAGIRTEHESTSAEEAREKLQKGLRCLIREGSVSKDMVALAPLLTPITAPYMCLCTDDRNPLDIAEHGHLDHMIRSLIALGCDPLAVYRAATLSAAEAFGLKDRGQIAPGKRADIVALPNLAECRASLVLCAGRVVNDASFAAREVIDPVARNSVRAPKVVAQDFRHAANTPETSVIGVIEGKIITEHLRETIVPDQGDKRPDPARDLLRVAVVERHGKNGNIATGFVRGFGMGQGAIAATVAHDHHNIVAVGADYDDIALAVNRLSDIEGGFVVASQGKVLAELPLPVAGLMSLDSYESVHATLVDLRKAAKSLGVTLQEPFLQLAFIALPVIPHLKITDFGMVDVDRFEVL
ncbi:adenine deaminase [Roseinatronobacter bogoriensis]|uniref:Adenine deaminase n=1 Tax=Roseinatronobacter bogoriensis subsp. barguzinensis TaxID=441209 RepID=A0A2K8KC70_9RHOB|nr:MULTISPECIES: adenine deaminase [Rhodobaca]ATX66576.1 adenine deaminase [Rhodobaca barguzinensis]MBB4207745.1 adenine deaminase [Rhodobaca bogoriensis DSM 18756]TDW39947.1 adenine deaminase [Rhodobaca barguzinensis]TDY70899.1 adenine deaminase [Rhodobaca bogoriensis DSM 18756]